MTSYLGTRELKSYAADWQVYRGLLEDDHLMAQLRSAVDAATREPGVRVGDPNALLRHLDVALWMHAEQLRRASGVEAAAG